MKPTPLATREPAAIVEAYVTAISPWGRGSRPFGPGLGLDEATEAVRQAIPADFLTPLAESVASHLNELRVGHHLTQTQWNRALGGTSPDLATAPNADDIRDGIERSMGLLDAFALPDGARLRSWADPTVATTMLIYHGVAWLRLVDARVVPSADLARGREAISLALASHLPESVGTVSVAEPDVRELTTVQPFPHTGQVFGSDSTGRYRLGRILRPSDNSDIYAIELVSPPAALSPAERQRLAQPDALVAKLIKAAALQGHTPVPIECIGISDFLMRPIARPEVPGHRIEILPRAQSDLYTWWKHRYKDQRRLLTGREVLALALPMLAGVVALHTGRGGRTQYVHGDLKLGQFLLGASTGGALQLSDLDLLVPAAVIPPSSDPDWEPSTTVSALGFTHGYVPLDHDGKRTSRRNDTWALGICWHLLLTNSHPADLAANEELADFDRARVVHDERLGGLKLSADLPVPWRGCINAALSRTGRPRPSELIPMLSALYPPVGETQVYGVIDLGDGTSLLTAAGGAEHVTTEQLDTTSARAQHALAALNAE
jgi:Serine/threonine protein kinase